MADNTMRAVRLQDYGPAENLVVERVPRPEPKAGEVLVRVHAAGVNPVDWKIRQGMLKAMRPLTFPAILGMDLAGIVEEVGPGVTAFQKGQEVYGGGSGAYAEYAIAQAGALAPKPRNLTFDQAASVPMGGRTAWVGIFDVGGLQAGQKLLVHGAAGGVGMFAVQFGRWKGAHVIGTASAANVEFVRSLGAETVVDYIATPFESVVRDVDVVFDAIGGPVQDRSWQVIKPGGILVEIGGPISEETAKSHGVRAGRVAAQPTTELLRQFTDLIESGALVTAVNRVFPLEQAAQAHALSETGHGRGRIVLHIAD